MMGSEVHSGGDSVLEEWVATEKPAVEDEEFDTVFDVLKNPRRRMVIDYLADHPSTTRSDLADYIAASENDVAPDDLTSAQRKRVYVALHQNHLPKLAEHDVITYDTDRGTVGRTDRTEEFLLCLQVFEPGEPVSDTASSRARQAGTAVLLTGAVAVAWLSRSGPGVLDPISVLILLLLGGAWGLVVLDSRR